MLASEEQVLLEWFRQRAQESRLALGPSLVCGKGLSPGDSEQGLSPELSVKIGPPAPLCETAKSVFDFRVQECHTSGWDSQGTLASTLANEIGVLITRCRRQLNFFFLF
jgi:hypothetical protein